MRELFKIGPRHSQDQPVPFHLYHLQSHNRTQGITPGTIHPSIQNTDPWHSSLLQDLTEGIQDTLSISEGSNTSDPILCLLYSTTDTMCEPHADLTPTCATSKITLLPSEPSLPSLTLPIFLTIFLTITQPITMMSQPVVPHMPACGDHSDESTHQIPSNGLLFSTFYHFPFTADPPTSTALMRPFSDYCAITIDYTLYPLHHQSSTTSETSHMTYGPHCYIFLS